MQAYLYIIKIRMQSALAYRFNVISTISIQCLLMFAMTCFWKAAYDGTGEVSGVGAKDMVTYAMISIIMGNLMTMGVEGRIEDSVRNGSVALDMLKPVSIYGMYLAEDIGDLVIAFFQMAVPLLILGSVLFGFPAPASACHFALFAISFGIGWLINWILAALLGMCAFKAISMGPIRNVKGFIMHLLSGRVIPLWFFPAGFRAVLELLPFVNIYQLPLGIYIGQYTKEEMLWRTGLQAGWCITLFLVFHAVQKKAARAVLIQGG